jgi:predicted ribosome quality control (RQC) complex YloA/Tae2 family protein
MATEEKIPSPSDLKKSPVQFTNEEITQLRSLQAKFNNATIQFGQLKISQLKLEESETILKKALAELENEETVLAKSLTEKYGKGSLDIETGTFTPAE